jgi:hypothetical protein
MVPKRLSSTQVKIYEISRKNAQIKTANPVKKQQKSHQGGMVFFSTGALDDWGTFYLN